MANPRQPDPADMAVADQRLKDAVELADAFDAMGAYADSKVKVLLAQVGKDGRPASIRTLTPPVDMDELIEWLREEYGPGDYSLKFMVDGKFKDNRVFSIAAPKSLSLRGAPPGAERTGGNTDLMLSLAKMQQDSSDKQLTLIMAMMQNSTQQMTAMMTAIIPALAGGRPADPAAMLASLATTFKSLQPSAPPPGVSPKEWIETLAALKELTGDGGGDDSSIMGMAKTFLPLIGQYVSQGRDGFAAGSQQALPAPDNAAPGPIAGNGYAAGAPLTPGHRIIAMIRDDLDFLLKRRRDTQVSAELLAEVLDNNGVTLDDLMAVVAEFQTAGNQWPVELAKHGIVIADQADAQWLDAVIAGLVELYTQPADAEPVGPESGKGGGQKNAGGNGAARAAGGV